MKMKTEFSHVHIHAAKALTLEIQEIEDALENGEEEKYELGTMDARVVHDGYAANAVISSMAFVEASINEFYDKMMNQAVSWDTSEESTSPRPHGQDIVNQLMLGLRDVHSPWFQNKGTLKKYQMLLVVAGREPFDTGNGTYQQVNTVRGLRNDLVHFEPEWYDGEDNIDTPGSLPGNLAMNPFYEIPREPYCFLSREIVEWCLQACAEFVLAFYEKMGFEHTAIAEGISELLDEE